MTKNQQLFAFIAAGLGLFFEFVYAVLWAIYSANADNDYNPYPSWIFSTLSELGSLIVSVVAISLIPFLTGKVRALLGISAAAVVFVAALIYIMSDLLPNSALLFVIGPFVGAAWATLAGIGIVVIRQRFGAQALLIAFGALAAGLILQSIWFVAPDALKSSHLEALFQVMILASVFELLRALRSKVVTAAALRLAPHAYPIELRIKKFFAVKAAATGMVFAIAAVFVAALAFVGGTAIYGLETYYYQSVTLVPGLGVTAIVALLFIWIPALIANRALAKGKSWDAFFWLSIFVSPLLMWIIAEASTDTRGMVYAPAQAPAPAYAQAAPATYAPAAVPAAPVAASDTRECPECAETIKKAAKLCKHCGSKVAPIA